MPIRFPSRWLVLCLSVHRIQQPANANFVPGAATEQSRDLIDGFPLLSSVLDNDGDNGTRLSVLAASPTESPSGREPVPPSIQNMTTSPSVAPIIGDVHVDSDNLPAGTLNPSLVPSVIPSTSPTPACHDLAAYQSPINGLPCSAHANTDCLTWRFLGLNSTELKELVDSCPITCGIECGTFQQFTTSLAFRLGKVSGFLDQVTTATLETTSLQYFQEYVRHQLMPSDAITVELENATLTFQDLVESAYNVRRQLRQPSAASQNTLNDPTMSKQKALKAVLLVRGFSIAIDPESIKKMLLGAMASSEYTNALRRSDDFFAAVEIMSQNDTVPRSPTPLVEDEVSDSSRATVFVSFMVPIVVAGFAIAIVVYHRYRTGAWLWFRQNQRQLSGDAVARLPERGSSPNISEDKNRSPTSGSPEASVASDDETTIAGTARRIGRNSLRRFFASLSLSRSRNSTETDSQDENEVPDPRFTANSIPVIDGPIASKIHYGLEDDDDRGDSSGRAFPPMIVIDNIDANENQKATNSDTEDETANKDKALDDFASEFRKAIKTHSKNSRSLVFPDAFKSIFETMTSSGKVMPDDQPALHSRSSLDMLFGSDSSDEDDMEDDDCSVASTPIKATRPITNPPLRRTSSFNTFDDIDRQILPVVEQENEEDASTQLSQNHFPDMAVSFSPPSSCIPPFSPSTPPEVIENGKARGLPPIRRFHTPERWRRARQMRNPPMQQEEQTRSPSDNHQQKPHRKAMPLFSFSPTTKVILESSGGAKRPSLPRMGSSSSSKSASSSSGHHRRTSSSSVSADGNRTFGGGSTSEKIPVKDPRSIRLEFVTPRRGQLGLVLGEKSARFGTYVVAVKDYSPLFGMVMKGDRMLEIGGKNVSHANLAEVTKMMTTSAKTLPFAYSRATMSGNGACNITNHPHHSLRIAVLRRLPPSAVVADPDHKRHGSHGSAGSNGSMLDSAMID